MEPVERDEQSKPTERDDGVDVSLIRWMLSLTPAERLYMLDDGMEFLSRCADGFRDKQPPPVAR